MMKYEYEYEYTSSQQGFKTLGIEKKIEILGFQGFGERIDNWVLGKELIIGGDMDFTADFGLKTRLLWILLPIMD